MMISGTRVPLSDRVSLGEEETSLAVREWSKAEATGASSLASIFSILDSDQQ
jgi:hypothetical protein